MLIDTRRSFRGALAGALAAAVWAAQQPLDKRVFGSSYDDVELLGRAVSPEGRWYPIGLAIHVGNGAAFGAVYAGAAALLPIPAWLRAPLIVQAENFGLWPLVGLVDRLHPAREELPKLAGNRRALAQATWRHMLFGVLLGEIERRLNPPEPEPPDFDVIVSSNGHGSLEHALSQSPS